MKEEKLIKRLDDLKKILSEIQDGVASIAGRETEHPFNNDYAIINGIKLKRKNETLRYCEHFTFDESVKLAKSSGLCVPTEGEWRQMLKPGCTWDDEKKGIWIGENHRLKRETDYSTFLPAAGCRSSSNRSPNSVGSNGSYWSSSLLCSSLFGNNFFSSFDFSSSGTSALCGNNRKNGLSLRCIKE
jgi:uncharacterized protein (TIGR02145 family)